MNASVTEGVDSLCLTQTTTQVKTLKIVYCFKFNEWILFWRTCWFSAFLPCDAMRCTVFVIVILSVCLSVTLVDCVHMVRPTIMISSPYGSPIILVSWDITFIPKFEGGHPERGRWMRVGWVAIGDFRPISRNGTRYDKDYYWSLIGNWIRAFDWYQNQRPWLTLKWHWTAICTLLHYTHVFRSQPLKFEWR